MSLKYIFVHAGSKVFGLDHEQCTGAYSGGRLGAPPPLDFQNLKRKSLVTHRSNRKRYKEEEGKRRISFLELLWPRKPPSLSPFLTKKKFAYKKNQVSMSTFKSVVN